MLPSERIPSSAITPRPPLLANGSAIDAYEQVPMSDPARGTTHATAPRRQDTDAYRESHPRRRR